MSKISDLFEKGKFIEVLNMTEKCQNDEEYFFHFLSLLALDKNEDALLYLSDNHQALERFSLVDLINVHLNLLLRMDRHAEAYKALDYYRELPYESQEVEELLKNAEYGIRNHEVAQSKSFTMSNEKVKKYLKSDDFEQFQTAIQYLSRPEIYIGAFEEELQDLLTNGKTQSIRAITLLLMCEKKYEGNFAFNYFGKIIDVDPKALNAKADLSVVKRFKNKIDKKCKKDVTLIEIAMELFNQFTINYFPYSPEVDDEGFEDPFISIAEKILNGIMPDPTNLNEKEEYILNIISPLEN